MAVVLEALTVEVHHLLRVRDRPEDVVVEEAVTVVRGLLRDLRAADAAVPDERRDAVERARGRREALEGRAELARPVHDLLIPQTAQERVVLDGELDAVADVLSEPRVDGAGVAAAHHEVHAAVGDDLEHRVVLGDLHRVVGRDERGARRQDDVLGRARQVAQQGGGGRGDERRVVVLAGREDVEARLVGVLRDGQQGLHALGVVGGAPGGGVGGHIADGEDPELHGLGLSLQIHAFACTRSNKGSRRGIPGVRRLGDSGVRGFVSG